MATDNSKKISLSTATITGMNAMIGAGIFTAPAVLASNIGPAGILTYIFVVCSVWFMAQSIASVARRFPVEGSFYTYAKQWGGHYVGVAAAAFYIIGLIVAVGLLTHVAGHHLLPFFPNINPDLLGFIALIILIVLNMFGAVLSQLGQRILIVCTVFPLLAIIGMSFTKANPKLLTPFAPFGFVNAMKATSQVIFGFFGFESAASLFNLVRNPEQNVPRALTYSIVLVGALYILFVTAIILSVPLNLFTSAKLPLAEVLRQVFPGAHWLITVIHISILSAVLGTIHSLIWGSSNLLISLVKKLQSRPAQSLINSKILNIKTSVLIIGAGILMSFTTITNIYLFFYLTSIFIVSSYIASMITLLTIKEEWKSGQNIKTILGIGTASMILIFAIHGVLSILQT